MRPARLCYRSTVRAHLWRNTACGHGCCDNKMGVRAQYKSVRAHLRVSAAQAFLPRGKFSGTHIGRVTQQMSTPEVPHTLTRGSSAALRVFPLTFICANVAGHSMARCMRRRTRRGSRSLRPYQNKIHEASLFVKVPSERSKYHALIRRLFLRDRQNIDR